MTLELASSDLKKEHEDDPTSTITYDKLKESVQAVVHLVGMATFYTGDRQNYQEVYPPKT